MSNLNQVVITRALDQNAEMIEQSLQLGLSPFILPLIETVALEVLDQSPLQDLLSGKFDLLILSSPNGTRFLKEALQRVETCPTIPSSTRIAVVGRKTAESVLHHFNRSNVIGADSGSAEALSKLLSDSGLAGGKILIGAAKAPYFPLGAELAKSGGIVQQVALYETRPIKPTSKQIAELSAISQPIVTFLSPSAVESFFAVPQLADRLDYRFAVIGGATAQAIKHHRATIWHQASESNGAVLLREIAKRL